MSRCIAVTGSASGIGQAVVTRLREAGDTVLGIDLADAEICADLSRPEGRRRAVEEVLERSGGVLDGLVACAGTSTPSPGLVSVNFFGVTALAEGLRPALAAAPAPRAVVVGSISGTQPTDSEVVAACLRDDEAAAVTRAEAVMTAGTGYTLYPSSKVALAQWLRRTCLAAGWADAGIPLNAVAPGVVLTPMVSPLLTDEAMKAVMDQAVPMPLHGYASPEAVAAVLCALISVENTHITGQVLYVDGGAEVTLRGPEVF